MSEELEPSEIIQRLVEQRKDLSDEAILAELNKLPILPDENDPLWEAEDYKVWNEHAYIFIALGDIAVERHLRPALPLLLEKACYGDPYDLMSGFHNCLEGIVNSDWSHLTEICMQAAQSKQRGARLWAVAELGILREAQSFETLINALADEADKVRQRACWSIVMLCQSNEECRQPAIEALTRYVNEQSNEGDKREGREAIKDIESMRN